jgi:ATP-dependent RNA helicase RhlE
MTGEAFTFVSREEEAELKQIERAIGKSLPRVTLPDFDYTAKPQQRFEVPQAERIAAIRAQRAAERARAKEKAERRAVSGNGGSSPARPSSGPAKSSPGGNRGRPGGRRGPGSGGRGGGAPRGRS